MEEEEHATPFEKRREEVDQPIVRLFREYGSREKGLLGLGVVANMLSRVATLAPPIILGMAIDVTFRQDAVFSIPFVPSDWLPTTMEGQLWFSAAAIGGSFLASMLFAWGGRFATFLFSQKSMHYLRSEAYEKMQTLDMTFFDARQTGEVMSVLNNDIKNLQTLLSQGVTELLRVLFLLLAVAAALVYLHWQLALVSLVAVPFAFLFTVGFMKYARPLFLQLRNQIGQFNSRIENGLSGIELIKASGTADYETERTRKESWELFEANWDVLKLRTLYLPTMRFTAGIGFTATFAVGGLWLIGITPLFEPAPLTIGTFVAFVFLSQRVVGPITIVGQVVDWYENGYASGRRIFGLMDIEPDIVDDPEALPVEDVAGSVDFEKVSFSYPGTEPVLRDINLRVEPGQTIGIVGPTGAGKSTLVKLVMRLYDPDRGRVLVDGIDTQFLRVADLRRQIGYVSQDAFLFDGTIAENIRYGSFDASLEEVKECAKAAQAQRFITNLPDGYQTRVGERGVMLSGGQRQRISIARALLQDPAILVLDEATSDVDTETEMLIQESLGAFSEQRTTFIVAHRLSTIKNADQIVVLENGQIEEKGSHEELLQQEHLYANLWMVQAGESDQVSKDFYELVQERASRVT